jgi:hypothetical protein
MVFFFKEVKKGLWLEEASGREQEEKKNITSLLKKFY